MTRTTEPTTKAEREEWRINGWGAHGFPERLLDDADELDALRRRVAVLEGASQELLSVIPSSADCALMVRACRPGGDAAAKTADSLVNQYYKIDPAADRLRAALSVSPPAPPDPNTEIVRRLLNWADRKPKFQDVDFTLRHIIKQARDAAALRAGAGGGA